VDENYVLRIPDKLDPIGAAPLLCAGITVFSPLRRQDIARGTKVAVIGLGGLGHLAVKFAIAMGAEVTVITTSPDKRNDAFLLGATDCVLAKDDRTFTRFAKHFDLMINTVSAALDYDKYIGLLRRDASMVLLGLPDAAVSFNALGLFSKRRSISGSLVGGIEETQQMLDWCATRGIVADVNVIPIQEINVAFERILKNDVRYRFVIDMKSLGGGPELTPDRRAPAYLVSL
jgi:uncharacterized zinc-type alcohol dehydrogenase-like protein